MRALKATVGKARTLRRELTLPEVLLWGLLRGERLSGFRFRRQHPVSRFVLDFFCSEARLAVEVDGAAHDHPDRVARDETRDRWLQRQGIGVLRVPARDLLTEDGRESVLATIAARLVTPHHPSGGPPPPLRRGGMAHDALRHSSLVKRGRRTGRSPMEGSTPVPNDPSSLASASAAP